MANPFYSITNPNIWNTEFLEDLPAFAYGAYAPQRGQNLNGRPRSFFDFYENRQAQLEREYTSQLGSQARSGQPPTGTNVDFLANYPWMARWLELSPEQRGTGRANIARWNIPR
jgi:hypothetical protein